MAEVIGFFLSMIPPTVTHQEKKVAVVNGKPRFYEPQRLRQARTQLCWMLRMHRPEKPFEGVPLKLVTVWQFPKGKSHKRGEWRITKPDTDNLQKLLKDCMTATGFWKDDALVVNETCVKLWMDEPGIWIFVEELADG